MPMVPIIINTGIGTGIQCIDITYDSENATYSGSKTPENLILIYQNHHKNYRYRFYNLSSIFNLEAAHR
jgi:hypothetical protein